jgi:ketosteroid isomerase-like protein
VWTDHVELCDQAYAAYSGGDIARLLELMAPDIEVYVAPPNFESGTYVGHAEYLGLIERWDSGWEEMRIEFKERTGAGDWMLNLVLYHGRGKGSAAEVTQPSFELTEWRDGLLRRYEVYFDLDAGRVAAAERGLPIPTM